MGRKHKNLQGFHPRAFLQGQDAGAEKERLPGKAGGKAVKESEINLGYVFMGSLLCRAGSFFCSFSVPYILQVPSYCTDSVIVSSIFRLTLLYLCDNL